PLLAAQRDEDFVIVSQSKKILASIHPEEVGREAPKSYDAFLRTALTGQSTVSKPFLSETCDTRGMPVTTIFSPAPVFHDETNVVAFLGLLMKREGEFSTIVGCGRVGESGESYAFGRDAVMLTASRFDDELKTLGLITNSPEANAILNVRLADPGFELVAGG